MTPHRSFLGLLLASLLSWQLVVCEPLKCAAVQEAWAKWHQELLTLSYQEKRGHINTRRKDVAAKVGCEAYQLSGDFSWLRRISRNWVPPDQKTHFESLERRQRGWRGKRSSGLLCPCDSPLSDDQLTSEGLQAMLWSALANEAGLRDQISQTVELKSVAMKKPDSVIVVGNSAKLEWMGNDTGAWIDSHAVVMRFNTNWRADQRHLAGSKRDVWVTGDYRFACGCAGTGCCTPEQLTALWDRVGPDVKVYNGQPPPGFDHPSRAHVAFRRWSSGPFLWNYLLWLHNRDHPEINTPFPFTAPTRSGMTGLFGLLINGIVPTIVGFDSGECLHPDYYEVMRQREEFAHGGVGATFHPAKVLMHYQHEPMILAQMAVAGLIRLKEPPAEKDCTKAGRNGHATRVPPPFLPFTAARPSPGSPISGTLQYPGAGPSPSALNPAASWGGANALGTQQPSRAGSGAWAGAALGADSPGRSAAKPVTAGSGLTGYAAVAARMLERAHERAEARARMKAAEREAARTASNVASMARAGGGASGPAYSSGQPQRPTSSNNGNRGTGGQPDNNARGTSSAGLRPASSSGVAAPASGPRTRGGTPGRGGGAPLPGVAPQSSPRSLGGAPRGPGSYWALWE
eukprot:jgi/Mesvir1/26475/Mv16145-RA.1